MAGDIVLRGVLGVSGNREVVLGFAASTVLYSISFADVLDESSGTGYQRRFSEKHSLDFRRYIRKRGSSTIPLTFNLRPRKDGAWRLQRTKSGLVRLIISDAHGKVLSQVDCQHRLGHIGDLEVSLPYMIFIGLTEKEELEIFNIINSKAKGLAGSLLDFHALRLTEDLGRERPELLIALHLNDTPGSPWYKQLDLGGKATSGLKRRASLRTMQKAVKRFLSASAVLRTHGPDQVACMVADFWKAVATVLERAWSVPRKHFLTKGIGVYALMGLLVDFLVDARTRGLEPNQATFAALLSDFAGDFDWSNRGPLKGLGGESGAREALELLRAARKRARLIA